MRFLRRRELVEAEQKSSRPPLVMTVRNPENGDAVEVVLRMLRDSSEGSTKPEPYVFAASIRRDLLGDPDWLASAVIRHLLCSLEGEPTLTNARQAIEHGGSTILTYRRRDGRPGDFQKYHAVYGREGDRCIACGTPVEKTVLSGRGTHFCPSCQR